MTHRRAPSIGFPTNRGRKASHVAGVSCAIQVMKRRSACRRVVRMMTSSGTLTCAAAVTKPLISAWPLKSPSSLARPASRPHEVGDIRPVTGAPERVDAASAS